MLSRRDVDPARVLGGNLLPRSPGELAAGGNLPAHAGGDLLERHPEDIVQDEDDTFGRAEPLQQDQQRQPDAVSAGSADAEPPAAPGGTGATNSISLASWARSRRECADLI